MGIGVLFVALGASAFFYFFGIIGNSPYEGGTMLGGLFWIFLGIAILRLTIPAFIPLKTKTLPNLRTCPYCGAIVVEDASICKKCKH